MNFFHFCYTFKERCLLLCFFVFLFFHAGILADNKLVGEDESTRLADEDRFLQRMLLDEEEDINNNNKNNNNNDSSSSDDDEEEVVGEEALVVGDVHSDSNHNSDDNNSVHNATTDISNEGNVLESVNLDEDSIVTTTNSSTEPSPPAVSKDVLSDFRALIVAWESIDVLLLQSTINQANIDVSVLRHHSSSEQDNSTQSLCENVQGELWNPERGSGGGNLMMLVLLGSPELQRETINSSVIAVSKVIGCIRERTRGSWPSGLMLVGTACAQQAHNCPEKDNLAEIGYRLSQHGIFSFDNPPLVPNALAKSLIEFKRFRELRDVSYGKRRGHAGRFSPSNMASILLMPLLLLTVMRILQRRTQQLQFRD